MIDKTLLRRLGRLGPLPLALALAGCHGQGAFDATNEKLAAIADDQGRVLAALDQLERKVENLPAAGAAPRAKPKTKGPRPGQPDPSATYSVAVGDAHTKGSDDALVTIVEWSDFQCPYCSRVPPTLEQLAEHYGDDLRIAFKHNPLSFHPRAMPAAVAAEAAGRQGKFWPMHDKLFENQKQLTDENFVAWAEELGLDVETFKKDLADPALAQKATREQKQGAVVGARGTPSFFVNGRFVKGAQPFAAFKTLIDEEMNKAKALVEAGTPRAKVYEAIVAGGKARV